MSELTIQWQSASGEKKSVKIPDTKGTALSSSKLGAPSDISYPVAVAVDDGWVISVPANGSSGKVKKGGETVDLKAAAKEANWTAKGEEGQLAVLRFKMGGDITGAKLEIPGGVLQMSAPVVAAAAAPAKAAPAAAAPAKAAPAPSAAAPAKGGNPPSGGPPKSGGGAPPSSDPLPEHVRQRTFRIILVVVLLLDILFMMMLGNMEVPEELYAAPTELPERFAQLIVPDQEPEEEEDSGGGGDEPAQEAEAEVAEEAAEDAGGGEEPAEASAPRSAEEKREAVRSKGILAVFAAKGRAGGALADVLGDGGIAAGLDQALSDVGGVVVAKRGMDITTQRGGGGAKSADIGNLKAGSGRGMGLGDKAKKTVKAGVKTANFTSQGSLSADAIRAVVEKNIRGVKFCYEKQLANNPDLQGKVVVKFTIETDGTVKKYSIENTTMNNADVEGCILKRVRRWKFPKPDKDAVTVSYPFIFTATG